ncbi:MAG: S41 family peptidase [Gemmatimonadota bacterium]|nr:S41 family peptidase [Gemmatimonadota bacterium]
MRRNRAGRGALLASLTAVLAAGGLLAQSPGAVPSSGSGLFETVRGLLLRDYVEPLAPDSLYDLAVRGLLREIGDPYAALIRPEDRRSALLTGDYGGVGMEILAQDEGILVLDVIPASPSSRLGLRRFDLIVAVDGAGTAGWSQAEAVGALRGPKGEPVQVAVVRGGAADTLSFSIVRDDVHLVAVESLLLEGGIGYARLTSFSQASRRELQAAVSDLIATGARSLILDFRYNQGGILREAVEIADLFLERGDQVVDTRARDPRDSQTYAAPGPDRYPGLPIVVLVNEWSASASEIVAGALQDHDRALVMGTRTFGKGVMQSVFPLPGGNWLRLTTGTWFTPSGRSIHRERSGDGEHAFALGSEAFNEAVADAVRGAVAGLPDMASSEPDADAGEVLVFRTAGGRPVYGGGGIVPDVLVRRDTVEAAERALAQALADAGESLSSLALRFAARRVIDTPRAAADGRLTPEVRRAFDRFVAAETRGAADAGKMERAREAADAVLARELAVIAGGDAAGLRLVLDRSHEVGEAARLLREARSPEALFALASTAGDVEPDGTDGES